MPWGPRNSPQKPSAPNTQHFPKPKKERKSRRGKRKEAALNVNEGLKVFPAPPLSAAFGKKPQEEKNLDLGFPSLSVCEKKQKPSPH